MHFAKRSFILCVCVCVDEAYFMMYHVMCVVFVSSILGQNDA